MKLAIHTPGHLTVFVGALALMTLAPPPRLPLAGGLCLTTAALLYPAALRAPLHPGWPAALALLVMLSALLGGPLDHSLGAVVYSGAGLAAGAQMALRALVLLVMVEGFTQSTEISAVAALCERAGLRGLGFSLGVAVNLLPGLRQASRQTWQSLTMRGGLRRRRWRALGLYLAATAAAALRRAEEVALAAETRAFTPEQAHYLPLAIGPGDFIAAALVALALLWIVGFGILISS